MSLIVVAAAWLIAVCIEPRMSWFTLMMPWQVAAWLSMLALAICHDALLFAALYKYLFLDKEP